MGAPSLEAQFLFIFCATTAPIPGALLGSYIADSSGGYKGKYQVQALLICCVFGLLASVAGVILFFLFEPIRFTIGLWFLLFLGAAIAPTCFGIIISSVPKSRQNASFAFG